MESLAFDFLDSMGGCLFFRSVYFMKNQMRPLLCLFVALLIITGVIYPFSITGIAQLFFPNQANGSLLTMNQKIVGSSLIGQEFSSDKYFWGRPSSTSNHPYSAFDPVHLTGSASSNLGPLSQVLVNEVKERVIQLESSNPDASLAIPIDLVTTSGSGLDADISPAAAYYQVPRVANARKVSQDTLIQLIEENTTPRQLGILGEPRVNVLQLNLALDGIQ